MELSRLAHYAADTLPETILEAGQRCAAQLSVGKKILVCGNGGSAADAAHFVAELIGRMGMERAPLAAVSLCVDPSVVTCIANDYGYENLFARQVEGLGRAGDVLVAISTSGRSENVGRAIAAARAREMLTVTLIGDPERSSFPESDVVIAVPSKNTARIQEIHTATLHALCDVIERTLFADQ
ncbi:MAG: SIS domain-containing protein [Sandaracinaceae bacterium]